MQYTELGKTKENVSILGFGAMRLPTKRVYVQLERRNLSFLL